MRITNAATAVNLVKQLSGSTPTAKAVLQVLDEQGISKYRMAQELGCFPVSINQWLAGTTMSKAYRDVFFATYGVKVDDTISAPDSTS